MRGLLIILFMLSVSSVYSQDSLAFSARNTLSTGISSRGWLWCINYDQVMLHREKVIITSLIGLSYWPDYSTLPQGNGRAIAVIISPANLLLGRKNNFFEFTVSTTYRDAYLIDPLTAGPIISQDDIKRYRYFSVNGFVGWRRQKPGGGFVYRAGYVPTYDFYFSRPIWQHGFELSAGYSFSRFKKKWI